MRTALRVIVRCEDAEQIKSIVPILLARGRTAIGIHETFGKSDGKRYVKEVPDPSIETAQFWVHQNKLMEGLDDPAFRLIAIFGRFTNARNLVQQVGRVIRNPELKAERNGVCSGTHRNRAKRPFGTGSSSTKTMFESEYDKEATRFPPSSNSSLLEPLRRDSISSAIFESISTRKM